MGSSMMRNITVQRCDVGGFYVGYSSDFGGDIFISQDGGAGMDGVNILNNEVTLIDNAYTRPWTVMKNYQRMKGELGEDNCNESNNHIEIGKEIYYLSADGLLMPAKKGQKPPDLRYFDQTRK